MLITVIGVLSNERNDEYNIVLFDTTSNYK